MSEVFAEHRPLLHAVAYRVLGSVTEAEDAVQEAWLRWDGADRTAIRDPRAYLVRITVNTAIDQLRTARRRREEYTGPWLPEPLVTGPDVAEDAATADEVSMAMLVVLETLSPLERAVFVLHEAFAFTYPEIATALGRTEAAVRQLAHRAREHVAARRPRFHADRRVRREVTERFLAAALGGDVGELVNVLAPDVTLVADSGGKVQGPRRPIHGADKVARFFAGVAGGGGGGVPADLTIRLVEVNGGPAVLLSSANAPLAVVVVDVRDDARISAIRLVGNPDKLAALTIAGEETP